MIRLRGPGRAIGRRWRAPIAVLSVSVLSGAVGFVAAGALQPADTVTAAATTRRPVTAAVEFRTLAASLVTRGDVGYGDPVVIRLGGTVQTAAGSGSLVVTRAARLDTVVKDGDVLAEVSGRPVFLLQGAMPMYRPIGVGSNGADVRELETALAAAGIDPGPRDGAYDQTLQRAVDRLYSRNGYPAPVASTEASQQLQARQAGVRQAQDALAEAQAGYDNAVRALTGPNHFEQEASLLAAQDALAQAQAAAAQADAEADAAVQTANAQLAAAQAALAQAQATGDDPARVGQACLADCLQALSDVVSGAKATATAAAGVLDRTRSSGLSQVEQAQLRLSAAQSNLTDDSGRAAVGQAQRALAAATDNLSAARADLVTATAQAKATIPLGEIVFQPVLPLRVREVKAAVGGPADGDLAVLAGEQRVVRATVALSDVADLHPGMDVSLDAGNGTDAYHGQVLKVGLAPSSDAAAEPTGELLVDAATVPDEIATGVSVRITVSLRSSGGKVMVVPLVAVTTLASGDSVVYVLESDGTRRRVTVRVALSADGLVEVAAVGGLLRPGDLVVVGE